MEIVSVNKQRGLWEQIQSLLTSPELSHMKQLKMEVEEEIKTTGRVWKLVMRMKYGVPTLHICQKSYGMSENTDKPRNFNNTFEVECDSEKIYIVILLYMQRIFIA